MAIRRLSSSQISTAGRGKSSSALAGYSPAIDEMDLIQRVVIGTTTVSTINISNIPQNYQHLQLRYIVRGADSGSIAYPNISLNQDFYSTNYSCHSLGGTGSAAYATASANTGGISDLYSPANSITSGVFASGICDILDYTNTSKFKITRTLHGYDTNGGGYIILSSGMLRSTNAITSVSLFNVNFIQNSTLSLYGVVA